jgi:hypothetical protein
MRFDLDEAVGRRTEMPVFDELIVWTFATFIDDELEKFGHYQVLLFHNLALLLASDLPLHLDLVAYVTRIDGGGAGLGEENAGEGSDPDIGSRRDDLFNDLLTYTGLASGMTINQCGLALFLKVVDDKGGHRIDTHLVLGPVGVDPERAVKTVHGAGFFQTDPGGASAGQG